KRVLRKTKVNPGFAFLISTPNELIEDLVENNPEQFKNQTFRCIKGDLRFSQKRLVLDMAVTTEANFVEKS
ncbi:MAG: hypothetical protein ACKO5L_03875, partial [Bacteroidota bacterium]